MIIAICVMALLLVLLAAGCLAVILLRFDSVLGTEVDRAAAHLSGPALGQVIAWDHDYVSVQLMGRGPGENWIDGPYYSGELTLPKVYAPQQVWAEPRAATNYSLCLVFWPTNCVEPIAVPYHRAKDDPPDQPWTPPDPDDLADSIDLPVADAPSGGWDQLRYPGE